MELRITDMHEDPWGYGFAPLALGQRLMGHRLWMAANIEQAVLQAQCGEVQAAQQEKAQAR